MLLEGVPGTAKTLMVRSLAAVLGLRVRAHPVHARPDAERHRRHARLRPADAARSGWRKRPDVHRAAAGRRDQPRAGQDAERAARGDAGAPGLDRRPAPPARRVLHRVRHAEPGRARGHLSAARGAARPLPAQGRGRLPERRGRRRRARARRAPTPARASCRAAQLRPVLDARSTSQAARAIARARDRRRQGARLHARPDARDARARR